MTDQIITEPDDLARCCEYLAGCRTIGFDTEFVGEDTYLPHLCLIQLATTERLILIDPLTAGPLDAFWNLLVDPERVVVVHAGREEVRLCQYHTGRTPSRLFDLQIGAGLAGFPYPMGHGALVNQLLGLRMAKAETLTEWRSRPLTRQQIDYAFDDVRHLLALWKILAGKLDALGRADWAQEECARLAVSVAPEEATTEKWRRIRGLGSLDRRKLAIVRELFNWREALALETNRPARAIVRDDLIVEIARRNPRKDRDLQVMRGLARRYQNAILEVVERARNLPPEQHPGLEEREQDPPQVSWLVNVLGAVLGDWCVRNQLAPNLAASVADLKLLVRAVRRKQPLPETLLTRGWRRRAVLPTLQAVLEGRRRLRIADARSETPFEVGE